MKCESCGVDIEEDEEMNHHGRVLCEDCYLDAVAPARACDPWAVYTAKSFVNNSRDEVELTDSQAKIIEILEKTGGVGQEELASMTGLCRHELENAIATLRHMEKLRGELRNGKKFIMLWDKPYPPPVS